VPTPRAGRGLGEGAARHFADRGALVTISGRREAPLRAVADDNGDRGQGGVGGVTNAAVRKRMGQAAGEHG
ncbi:MAG: hypothetical protein VW800_07160, partial [Acidimicrobiaceae bacterium]